VSQDRTRDRPKVPVLRHLARTGGTLITKCLGSMTGVVVLSELHPNNLVQTNPMAQAIEWFGLVTKDQARSWQRAGGPTFDGFIRVCHDAAAARGDTLVVREWSHLDYHGVPFCAPTMRSGVCAALGTDFECVQACTVRHPIDQYLSLMDTAIGPALGLERYLAGAAAFAREAREIGFVRYEDFTRDPDTALSTLCDRLGLAFDPGYRDRWPEYATVTGDTASGIGRGAARREIEPMKRREPDADLLGRCRASAAYLQACDALGYEA